MNEGIIMFGDNEAKWGSVEAGSKTEPVTTDMFKCPTLDH